MCSLNIVGDLHALYCLLFPYPSIFLSTMNPLLGLYYSLLSLHYMLRRVELLDQRMHWNSSLCPSRSSTLQSPHPALFLFQSHIVSVNSIFHPSRLFALLKRAAPPILSYFLSVCFDFADFAASELLAPINDSIGTPALCLSPATLSCCSPFTEIVFKPPPSCLSALSFSPAMWACVYVCVFGFFRSV